MVTKDIVWIVSAILVGLALVEVAIKYFKAGKIAEREKKKWEHLIDVRKRESDTLAQALGQAKISINKLVSENRVLSDNATYCASRLEQALMERDSYKDLYETEARKQSQANSMGGREPIDESMRLNDFFVFAHQPTKREVKDRFKRLSSIYHPDKGGDIETMQEINTQYQRTLKFAA
ncbi:hypothetical protein AB4306_18430 [Vibrio splendidus]